MKKNFHTDGKLSELRQDLVSGDWIVIAPRRAKRPDAPHHGAGRKRAPVRGCPFEDFDGTDEHPEPILNFSDKRGWRTRVIENRFPAFVHRNTCSVLAKRGPYAITEGIGHHDLVITRDHDKDFPELDQRSALEVFQAFRERYFMLLNDKCLAYLSIFHNWGPKAGASVYHPHYQMIAVPVVPPDVEHSLLGSERYFKKEKTCVHCTMINWEIKEKKRVVWQNEYAIAVTPFVSRSSFELRVFPKRHLAFFENTPDNDLAGVVQVLQKSLGMMRSRLHDPDYNFFIHTAPMTDRRRHGHYHWHIEVLPKTNIFAGFELGTGIEINPVDPDDAARMLRGRG
jgi:UDPglucose--hexose-1-phosphate uridylyltransferase